MPTKSNNLTRVKTPEQVYADFQKKLQKVMKDFYVQLDEIKKEIEEYKIEYILKKIKK
ncbi:MAG: hypothetical protein WCV92_00785 [Candidatus Buchananbacteria bacterium]